MIEYIIESLYISKKIIQNGENIASFKVELNQPKS